MADNATAIADLVKSTTELTNEVALQKDRLVMSSDMAVASSENASKFATIATDATAKATQISGLDTVDSALAAREGFIVGASAEVATGTRMKRILDANGNWNTMYAFPAFTFDDVGMDGVLGTGVHPAFLKPNGELIPVIWFPTCDASNQGGFPVFKSGSSPWSDVSPDFIKQKFADLGEGWHTMTALEWSAVALWCLANEFQPEGNTEYGRSHASKFNFGQRVDKKLPNDRSGTPRIVTGSGPNAFRHNNDSVGISDLVGNLWIYLDGVKLVNGVINAASRNMQDESQWTNTGISITSPNEAKFANVTLSGTSELLKQLLLEPVTQTQALKGIFGSLSTGTMVMARGGSYDNTDKAGLAAVSMIRTSDYQGGAFSYRACYVGA